jgi:membrane-associated phospholipid phosphatase
VAQEPISPEQVSPEQASPEQQADRSAAVPATAATPAIEEPAISLKQLAGNVIHDQKPIFTFPWRAAHGAHWTPVVGVVLGTAALVILDPYTESYFHNPTRFNGYKTGPLRGRNSTLAITMTPVAFFVTGLAKHSTHARNTGLLAAEAVADTQILSFVMKQAIGRSKPSDIPPDGSLRDTWFKYKGSFSNGGSFPSGHTASAFAVATVVASRYKEHRWLPYVAYGAATFLSLTRLPDRAHFASDIFFGAAMGYGISHFIVLGRHTN